MTAAHHHLLHRYSVHSAALLQSTERTFLSLWVCLVSVCRPSRRAPCLVVEGERSSKGPRKVLSSLGQPEASC